MKLNRTKNATKGIFFGTFLNLYKIIIKFVMRTIMIYTLGVEYLGLDGLFVSLLKMLSLAELGVGGALTFSMYKPIADNDEKTICALMKLYKLYYRIIGFVILTIGLVICPFVPKLIKSDLPSSINIYILYIMNLMTTVLSYWLFAYKNSILHAHQRNDVISKITIIVNTLQYTLQIVFLLLFKNFYLYIIVSLIFQVILNITIAIVANKMYPNYKAIGKVEKKMVKDINQKVKDLFTSKIGGVIYSSADTIVISSFLGLTALAIFENYNYIITAIMSIINVIFLACTAGIGNSLITESQEKNYNDFRKFTFILLWLITICSSCILNSMQDFITAWLGPDLLLSFKIVICLVIYFYVYELITIFTTYKDAAGMWHKDRYRTLMSSITNLTLNIFLVNKIGLYGIILSSVISLVIIAIPWLLHNLFTELFSDKLKAYINILIKYVFASIIIVLISYFVCSYINFDCKVNFIIKNMICACISIFGWIVIFYKTNEIIDTKILFFKMLKGGKK